MGQRRRALVVQGGGMRGAYAAGALIGLFEQRPRFDAVWATSSGAASAAYGVAGQPEGINIWRDHLHGRRLVRPLRLATGGSVLDLHYLIDEVFRRRIPLNVDALRAANIPFEVPATDVETGEVRYFDLRYHDVFEVLRAAMSLPGGVVEAVPMEGRRYVDGGVIDQLPIERAVAWGAEDIVVVMTRGADYVARPTGRMRTWLATRKFPGLRAAMSTRHLLYARAMELLDHPPPGIRIRLVRPETPLPVSRWTTRRDRLIAAIERGFEDARGRWQAWAADGSWNLSA